MKYNGEILYRCDCGNILRIGFYRTTELDLETDLFHNYIKYDYSTCPHCEKVLKFDETFRIQKL